jgi:hypothetical protein
MASYTSRSNVHALSVSRPLVRYLSHAAVNSAIG